MKNICITGANGAIGSSLVNKLSINNKIYAIVKKNNNLVFPLNDNIEIFECDLNNIEYINQICNTLNNRYVKIDYLICNAGIGPNSDYTYNEFIQINFLSHLQLSNNFKQAQLICISSLAVDDPWTNCKNSIIYASSKCALESLARSRENEISKPCYNIVCGSIKSKMLLDILDNDINCDIWKNAYEPTVVSDICKRIIDFGYIYNDRRIYINLNNNNNNLYCELSRKYEFSSSHCLNLNELSRDENVKIYGKCNNIHGHNYNLKVRVYGKINKYGFIINTKELDEIVIKNIIEKYDHKNINNCMIMPTTTENLGLEIQKILQNCLPEFNISIELNETSKTSVVIKSNNKNIITDQKCHICSNENENDLNLITLETAFKKIIPKTANLECLTNTPKRAAIAWKQNMENDKPLNLTTFKGQTGVVINQTNIPIDSVCEHHLLPFFGTAEVEYISNGLIIGLSKIEQLCNYICKGLHIQEDITEKISEELSLLLKTDVTVKLSCEHTCMRRYGSQKGIVTNTIYKSIFNNTNNKIL